MDIAPAIPGEAGVERHVKAARDARREMAVDIPIGAAIRGGGPRAAESSWVAIPVAMDIAPAIPGEAGVERHVKAARDARREMAVDIPIGAAIRGGGPRAAESSWVAIPVAPPTARKRAERQRGVGAGDRAIGIGDHDTVSRNVGLLHVGDGQRGSGCAGNVAAIAEVERVLTPLIGEDGIAAGDDGEIDGRARADGLALWLGGDAWQADDRQDGIGTGGVARTVTDLDRIGCGVAVLNIIERVAGGGSAGNVAEFLR